jgi:hypothetical protein
MIGLFSAFDDATQEDWFQLDRIGAIANDSLGTITQTYIPADAVYLSESVTKVFGD